MAKAPQTITFVAKEPASADVPPKVAVGRAPASFVGDASGRYERQRLLGQGGMGTVTLVHDRTVGRNVALKQLNEDATDEDAIARFAREARVQGQLEHPAIVPVYDVGTAADGRAFFTMKRVRGESLAEILEERASGAKTSWSLRKLLSAFSQLCAAAHYAHERGVVHRDIKPMNVMLGAYGEVYLLDWGVAKVAGEPPSFRRKSEENIDAQAGIHTGFGAVMGTLTTMSPEQAVGGEVDARTDVYALGAILFEILTGQHFHPRGDVETVLEKIIQGVEARASIRAPEVEVPPELEELCVKATKLQPADRLASSMAMRDAIEAYLDGDRDLELRREAAKKHAATARVAAKAALEAGDGARPSAENEEVVRANALGEVGKALAFDPENKEALATLVTLLTTPPRVTPREVEEVHRANLERNIRRGGIAAAIVYGYISINALATWNLGVKDVGPFFIAHTLWALAFVSAIVTIVRKSYGPLLVTFLFGIGTSTFVTSIYGPYLLVPTFVTIHALVFALVRDWRPRLFVIGVACLGWTVSVFGQSWGIFPNTVRFVDGGIDIRSTVLVLPPTATTFFLYSAGLAAIVGPALVVGAIRSAYYRSEIATLLQSWQLKKLASADTSPIVDPETTRRRKASSRSAVNDEGTTRPSP